MSPGCNFCYAFTLHDQRYVARRAGKKVSGAQYDLPFSQVQLLEDRLAEPLRWRTPRAVFVDSMSDLFHDDVPDDYLDRVFESMARGRQHIFMVLTKRPERMRAYLSRFKPDGEGYITRDGLLAMNETPRPIFHRWPLPNVWLGVSVEDQERADERIPLLLQTPAAVRFISAEPLLGPIHLGPRRTLEEQLHRAFVTADPFGPSKPYLDWVICGGESGKGARPMDLAWARSLRDQCRASGVPFFMKQLGARVLGPDNPSGLRRWILSDGEATGEWTPPIIGPRAHERPENAIGWVPAHGHGGEPGEWPEDLRVREWPTP